MKNMTKKPKPTKSPKSSCPFGAYEQGKKEGFSEALQVIEKEHKTSVEGKSGWCIWIRKEDWLKLKEARR